MPKILKPDGLNPPTTKSRAEYFKLRYQAQGRKQDGTLTAKRIKELQQADKVCGDTLPELYVCPSCGLCFNAESRRVVLLDQQGRIHHVSHLKEIPQ